MENTPKDKIETPQEVQNPSRRRLLKFLAAGGAVTAVSLLPGKWSSPTIKTGVLPAHAQVTPGRYEVRCNPEYDTSPGDGTIIFFLAATAWDTTENKPVVGVELTAAINPGQGEITDTVTTNAQGIANFEITLSDNEIPGALGATVRFTNQQIYGTDTCTIDFGESLS